MKITHFPHLYRHAGIPRGIPLYGRPHFIPICRCIRGKTVILKFSQTGASSPSSLFSKKKIFQTLSN